MISPRISLSTLLLFVLCMLSIPVSAIAEYPVLLPMLTNEPLGVGARRLLVNLDAEHQANMAAPRITADTYYIYEDIYAVDGGDDQADVSGQGYGTRLTWYGKQSGYGYFDTHHEDIAGEYQSTSDRTVIDLDFTEQSGYLKMPVLKLISIGGCYTARCYDAQGNSTYLSGVLGESISPLYSVKSDQQSYLLFTAYESQAGGASIGLGHERMQNSFTLVDTDRITVPIDHGGDIHAVAGWLKTKSGRLSLAYSSSDQQGDSPVRYNDNKCGESKTAFAASQWSLLYSGVRWRLWVGTNETYTSNDAHGVLPNSNSLSVIAKGTMSEKSVYGGAHYDLFNRNKTNVGLSYTLHRIDIQGEGRYRSGYLGGLIEFERLSGSFDNRYWMNVLSLDASREFGRWKLGYSGTLYVPIIEQDDNDSTPPVPEEPKSSERGGLTHVFSLSYAF